MPSAPLTAANTRAEGSSFTEPAPLTSRSPGRLPALRSGDRILGHREAPPHLLQERRDDLGCGPAEREGDRRAPSESGFHVGVSTVLVVVEVQERSAPDTEVACPAHR